MNIKKGILFTAAIFLIGGCGSISVRQTNTILNRLETNFHPPASTTTAFRVILDTNDDVQRLIRLNNSPYAVLYRFNKNLTTMSDDMVALSSYVLEKRNHHYAILALERYLKSNPGNRGHIWGGTFAVRALLKLKNIPDASGGYNYYSDELILRAIYEKPRAVRIP